MITRPSISELIEGVTRNLEWSMGQDPELIRSADFLINVLQVVDRVDSEWSGWAERLAADNRDIAATLTRLGAEPPGTAARSEDAPSDPPDPARRISDLEAGNRELKRRLVEFIEDRDLPAGAGSPPELQDADREVQALLLRILHREAEVAVPASRINPTSGGSGTASLPLSRIAEILQRFLAGEMPEASDIVIGNLQPLPGGASREAWIFDVRWRVGDSERQEPCILLREPLASVLESDESAEKINGSRRTVDNECRVIRAMEAAGLPVAHVLWFDATGEWLERPFSVARRLAGTADVAPILGTEHAEPILTQYLQVLAQLHTLDPAACGVDFLGTPSTASAALDQVVHYEGAYHKQRLEDFPAITYIIRWLKKQAPEARRIGIVHGDFRLGNFLYDSQYRFVALLDWEQVHVGDPIEEIAFMYWTAWSLDAIVPIESFIPLYERATGAAIDRDALAYYRVFIEFKMLVVLLTGLRSYFGTPDRQLRYGGAMTPEMIRDAQLRVLEELARGGPTIAFDAYRKPEVANG